MDGKITSLDPHPGPLSENVPLKVLSPWAKFLQWKHGDGVKESRQMGRSLSGIMIVVLVVCKMPK